jgi:hypothetical protein
MVAVRDDSGTVSHAERRPVDDRVRGPLSPPHEAKLFLKLRISLTDKTLNIKAPYYLDRTGEPIMDYCITLDRVMKKIAEKSFFSGGADIEQILLYHQMDDITFVRISSDADFRAKVSHNLRSHCYQARNAGNFFGECCVAFRAIVTDSKNPDLFV